VRTVDLRKNGDENEEKVCDYS